MVSTFADGIGGWVGLRNGCMGGFRDGRRERERGGL